MKKYDVVVIGGGFFGCNLALHLKKPGNNVLVLEKESDLMTRASYNNQARVHGGYHYPRSLLTALRSRVNFAHFVADYEDCIDSSFKKYYAVAKHFSKVSARHFFEFYKRIEADIERAPAAVKKLFNDDLTEEVFTVKEYAFDSHKLRKGVRQKLDEKEVEYRLQTEAESLKTGPKGTIILRVKNLKDGTTQEIECKELFNCAYAQINKLNANSKLPLISLKHELTEMALVDVPDELKEVGVTVMDGPFFSVMPFPPRRLHTLSHVRYTPHVEWHDAEGRWRNGHKYLADNRPPSAFAKMMADAKRYIPALGKATHVDSLWEVKTILPTSEDSDSRPILFVPSHGNISGYTCIMGGKIDNIQDVLKEVDILHGEEG